MIDDELVAKVDNELRLAGLQRHSFGTSAGGFGIQPFDEWLTVGWKPSKGLSEQAFEKMAAGDTSHESVRHMGTVMHAMADAILVILRSAGLNVRMSTDDLSPGTVEVRPNERG
jgi:hypothetical protein